MIVNIPTNPISIYISVEGRLWNASGVPKDTFFVSNGVVPLLLSYVLSRKKTVLLTDVSPKKSNNTMRYISLNSRLN